MVVVVLIAVLATIAAPSFSEARNDRIAFDYARQYQQLLVQARSRAAGTGSAHLALLGPGAGGRGFIRLYAALDGQPAPPLNVVGPNPVASCKADPTQWAQAEIDPPILNGNRARFIDWSDLNRAGVNDNMDVRVELLLGTGVTGAVSAVVPYLAICITPAGVTYVGTGATPTEAINGTLGMRAATPFTGIAEMDIQRHSAGTGIGIKRRVMVTGGGAPRLRSE